MHALPPARWAVATSASAQLARVRLECAGLPLPEVLVSSELVKSGKPDPEGYLLAARLLQAAPERCLVIEDTPVGLQAGRAARMTVVGVSTTFSSEDLRAKFCIRDFSELTVTSESCLSVRFRPAFTRASMPDGCGICVRRPACLSLPEAVAPSAPDAGVLPNRRAGALVSRLQRGLSPPQREVSPLSRDLRISFGVGNQTQVAILHQ